MGSSTGNDNTALGFSAGRNQTSGSSNVYIGKDSAYKSGVTATGSGNVFMGYQTGINNTASNNVFIGYQAGLANTSGVGNTLIGYIAGKSITGANSYNTVLGDNALATASSGDGRNTAIGQEALYGLTTGSYNSGFGLASGKSITTGTYNTFLGVSAGSNASQKVDATNSMALGNGAYTTASNQIVLGNADVTDVYMAQDGEATVRTIGIKTDTTAATDLTVTCGALKTLVLATSVYDDLQFAVSNAKVTPNNLLPNWEAFTTNTSEFAFAIDEEVDTQANELPH
jgi:hypothetical protein